MPSGFHGVKGRQIIFLICLVCARIYFNLVGPLMIVCVFHALGGVVLICSSLGEIIYHVHQGYHVDTYHPTDAKI
jgi:hypothetical protein